MAMPASLSPSNLRLTVSNPPFRRFSFTSPIPPLRLAPNPLSRFRVSATLAVQAQPDLITDEKEDDRKSVLACPICYTSLDQNNDSRTNLFSCQTCKKSYSCGKEFLDLTISSSTKEYGEVKPLSTELFRTALVSFLYERGWRQSFIWGGFPGPEKEFEMAKTFLQPTMGGTIVDASCGSGLFSRLFAKSGLYSLVVAMDFSENMLRQCYEFIEQDAALSKENLLLVRADISRLPFVSNSIDAVHAGAALHCWPSPSTAVAEISRILKPGGLLVATTFILDGLFTAVPALSLGRQFVAQISSNHFYLSEGELQDLCTTCGLVDFKCIRNGSFIMLAASKPG